MTKYPRGKLNEDDEGELKILVGQEQGNVVLDFGKSVVWIAMPPQEAADFASTVLRHAREAAREAGIVITVEL